MSLWSSLYVGVSGLQTSQNALNTVAHNLTNVDTEGYTRQQVQQSDKQYITVSKTDSKISYQQTGLGVSYSNVKQIRDDFLDKTYRAESGRNSFYEFSSETLLEIEDLLGEMNGEAFQTTLSDLWTSVQELAKDPCSSVTQSSLVQEASEFLSRAQAVYDGLSGYQDNLNLQVRQKVDQINKYGEQLKALNDTIRTIEAGGVEKANDARDSRNQLLDQLAQLCSISYDEDPWGNVCVQIEGTDFVKGETVYHIALDQDSVTGFYTPYWPQNTKYSEPGTGPSNTSGTLITVDGKDLETGRQYDISNAHVFNLNKTISSEMGTDIGGLKAILLARGDHRANYTDIPQKPTLSESDPDYAAAMKEYNKQLTDYNNGVSQSILMNIQSEFDQLIHNVITAVNDVLADAAGVQSYQYEYVDDYGQTKVATVRAIKNTTGDDTAYNYLRGDDNKPLQLFEKNAGDGYVSANDSANEGGLNLGGKTLTLLDENGKIVRDSAGNPIATVISGDNDYWIYVEEQTDPNSVYTLYSLANTQINQELMQSPAKLGFRLEDGSEDQATMEKLKAIFTGEDYTLNPNVLKKVSLLDYYDDLVSQVANSAYVFESVYENQQITTSAAENARDQVHAVSSDEELSNMIKFQSAYNASSRFINVVNQMLEHLVTSLG